MSSETQPVSFPYNEHPNETQLLLALERELSPEEVSQIENHLGNCWHCRARSEEMQRGILAFVEYREKRYLPALPAPPTGFSGFQAGLRSVVTASSRPGLLTKIWRWFLVLFAFPGQVKWISAVALTMVAVLFWVEVLNPPVVSANELVTRAIAAQNPASLGQSDTSMRVAHQKLQIHSGGRTVVREFEWTVGQRGSNMRWAARFDPLYWNAPLTAVGFGGWRDSLEKKQDKVKRSGEFLTLSTSTDQDWIREAWMIVRARDFHPVEQHFRFADNQELELKELAFQISEQAPVQSAPSGSSKPKEATTAGTHTVSPVDLDESELQLRYTLFIRQWDTGEDLKMERIGGRITLSGIVSSAEREKAMRTTLTTLPNIRLSLSAPNAHASSSASRKAMGVTDPATPTWENGLEKAFSDREERLAFVDRCISSSDTTVSHAWTLKGLADRYGEVNLARFQPESRRKLLEIVRGHLLKVRQANHDLEVLSHMLPASASSPPPTAVSWSAGIQSLFTQVQQQDASIASLLVGTQRGAQDLRSTSADFQSAHRRSSILLDSIDQLLTAVQ